MRSSRATRAVIACAAIAGVAGVTALAPAARATGASSAAASRTATIAYPGCPAGSVLLKVTVPRAPVPPGVAVRYSVTLRNTSPQTCGPSNTTTTLTNGRLLASTLLARCGQLPVAIANARGEQVYPPFLAILCPLFVAPKLVGGATVTAALSWNQMEGGGRPARRVQRAPSGTYHVTVKGTPRAAFVLATRSASSAGRAPKGRGQEHRHTVTVGRSGHIGFENCPRKEIVATVTVPARPVAGKAVTYTVALHNLGATPCGPSSSAASSRRAPLTVGPCGILPALVRNAAGADIYPGPVVMNCPNEAFIDIPAHATVRATGIWPGTQAHLTGPTNTHTGPPALVTAAPPGHYRLVVGQRPSTISVPFTLVAAPGTGAAGGQ